MYLSLFHTCAWKAFLFNAFLFLSNIVKKMMRIQNISKIWIFPFIIHSFSQNNDNGIEYIPAHFLPIQFNSTCFCRYWICFFSPFYLFIHHILWIMMMIVDLVDLMNHVLNSRVLMCIVNQSTKKSKAVNIIDSVCVCLCCDDVYRLLTDWLIVWPYICLCVFWFKIQRPPWSIDTHR